MEKIFEIIVLVGTLLGNLPSASTIETPRARAQMRDNWIVASVPFEELRPSQSGKTLIVASQTIDIEQGGVINVVAYVTPSTVGEKTNYESDTLKVRIDESGTSLIVEVKTFAPRQSKSGESIVFAHVQRNTKIEIAGMQLTVQATAYKPAK